MTFISRHHDRARMVVPRWFPSEIGPLLVASLRLRFTWLKFEINYLFSFLFRSQLQSCSCYKLGTDGTEFRKIAESQDRGFVIYQYAPETKDVSLLKRAHVLRFVLNLCDSWAEARRPPVVIINTRYCVMTLIHSHITHYSIESCRTDVTQRPKL